MSQLTLYDTDFYAWTQEQAALLRDGKARDLDWEHVAEEIASLGISEERALASHLKVLLVHLLKWQYEPTHRQEGTSWEDTIEEARQQLEDLMERSGSLRRLLDQILAKQYLRARKKANRETQKPLTTFPARCPWTVTQILAEDFFPEG